MSVTNRKMFRRDARNKLRNMGGIMASSEPLIQEVAKFQDGKSVYFPATPNLFIDALSRIGLIPRVAQSKDIKVSDPSELSGSQLSEALKSSEAPGVETRFGAGSRFIRSVPDIAAGAVSDVLEGGLKFLNPNQLTNQSIMNVLEGKVPRSSVQGIDMQAQIANSTLPNKSELLGINENLMNLPRDLDQVSTIRLDPGKAAAVGEEFVTVDSTGKIITDQSQAPEGTKVTMGEGRFRRDAEEEKLRKDTAAAKLAMQKADREGEIMDVREAEKQMAIAGGMPLPNQVGETDTFALQQELSGGQLESGRGQTLGVTKLQAESQKALQTGNTSDVKKTIDDLIKKGGAGAQQAGLKQLIKEFTDNAPEYEGLDKGLALAKIGFAMAAGESPNAIVNISKALSDGADMFIADDMKRKDFKRNVDLSALQYGLGEISKMRGEARAQARTLLNKQFEMKYFVTTDPETGEYKQIAISEYDLATKGLPEGALTSSFVEKLLTKRAAALKLDADALKDATVKASDVKDYRERYTKNVTAVIESTNAVDLVQRVMARNAQKQITGAVPAGQALFARAAALAGITVDTKYTNKDLAIDDLKAVFQKLIPLTLGEDQSANSISDRDVTFLANAFIDADVLEGGVTALIAKDPRAFNAKLQKTLGEFQRAQENALAQLNDLEQGEGTNFFYGLNRQPLGTAVASQRARLDPFIRKGFRGQQDPYFKKEGDVFKLFRG
jgi:hypothetical protein